MEHERRDQHVVRKPEDCLTQPCLHQLFVPSLLLPPTDNAFCTLRLETDPAGKKKKGGGEKKAYFQYISARFIPQPT